MIHVTYLVDLVPSWHQIVTHPPSVGDVVEITQTSPLTFSRAVVVLRIWRRNLKDDGSQYLDLLCEPHVEGDDDGSKRTTREGGKAHAAKGQAPKARRARA